MAGSADAAPTLIDHVERYIKHQGLYTLIPEHRRSRLFQLPVAPLWISMVVIASALPVLPDRGLAAFVGVLVINTMVVFIVGISTVAVLPPSAARGDELIMCLACAGVTISAGLLTESIDVAVSALAFAAAASVLAVFLDTYSFRVLTLWGTIRLAWQMAGKSAALLAVLMPLLLALVIFAIFSQEIWQALAGIRLPQIWQVLVVIFFPSGLLLVSSLGREATLVIGEFPSPDGVMKKLADRRAVQSVFGHRAETADVDLLRAVLRWRSSEDLRAMVTPAVHRRVVTLLVLLFLFSTLVLLLSFWIYFFVLFKLIFPPALIQGWIELNSNPVVGRLTLVPGFIEYNLTATTVAMGKVSLLLGAFMASISNIYAITDETVQRRYQEWLSARIAEWLAAGCAYVSLTAPDHHLWQRRLNHRKTKVSSLAVLVRHDLDPAGIERVCREVRSQLGAYKYVILHAVVRSSEGSADPYRSVALLCDAPGMNGNGFLTTSSRRAVSLEDRPAVRPGTGRQDPANKADAFDEEEIISALASDESTREAVHTVQALQLQPFVLVDVWLTDSRKTSRQYGRLLRDILKVVAARAADGRVISIAAHHGDEQRSVASLVWIRDLEKILIFDEHRPRSRAMKEARWLEVAPGA